MNPLKIIQKYYDKNSKPYHILVKHSESVAKKALEIAKKAKNFNPDLKFIKEASMLHDIGMFLTNAPKIECSGKEPYICHGVLGRELLEKEGFPRHALVCERHVGVGMSIEDIKSEKLPLPKRNMLPVSIEEEIICFADKFFSKKEGQLSKEEKVSEIKKELLKYGKDKEERFDAWLKKFNYL